MLSKFKGILLVFVLFSILEIVVRIVDTHYLEQPEIFFVNLKKQYVESGRGDADILIIGDSRSMALAGYQKQNDSEYSVYNHSLPAMGPKYYRFFIEKYLRSGNKKPKMVLFAASPKLYSAGYGAPLYDPTGKHVSQNESLSEYIQRRWNEGWEKNLFRSKESEKIIQYSGKQDNFDQILWEFFGHRYLHQFSISELWEQYDGVERIFIISKAIPLLYETYRFHGAIRNALSLENWKLSKDYTDRSKFCEACANIEAGICLPSHSQREDNHIIEDQITRHHGKYNISNRVKPELVQFARAKYKEEMKLETYSKDPATWEPVNFQVMEDLIQFSKEQGIHFGFVYLPWIDQKERAPEVQARKQKLLEFFRSHPDSGLFFFPSSEYPIDLFVDLIHYDCRGETRVNQEFQKNVLPQVFSFLKKHQNSN
ncbi:hypothetical protein LPTSP4_25930 [Leptospira ryugenii]|uniref:DUF1574 domain-containing protein n=1 Tax=Leptospira ryugenii TaxID=1917863 RepID=A0A2P2E2D7_9LEPT|nr:DUF1574 domain-containing protein [Leptospira ryugenii]GBF51062.1 hypothetical protein LPTSP4_25930 [Leptospira ryugenii]